MIKRRFYRLDHGDGSDASSSSSDSEIEAKESTGQSEDEFNHNDDESSGNESEDNTGNDIAVYSSGFLDEDDDETEKDEEAVVHLPLSSKDGVSRKKKLARTTKEKAFVLEEIPDCMLQCNSVFKCKICPGIICLTQETVRAHLSSKRHARSEKLLKEGRLKSMLNSKGEIENQETPAEVHARVVALAEKKPRTKKPRPDGQKKKISRKKKVREDSKSDAAKRSTKAPPKKKHKREK